MRFRLFSGVGVTWWLLAVGFAAVGETPEPFDDDCSSVALSNRGQAILGGNLDWIEDVDGMLYILKRGVVKTGLSAGTTGVTAHWTAKYASLAFSLVGYQHAWAGMNERGLVFSTMGLQSTGNPPPDERPPLTMMWPQYILDTCETVEDVIASDTLVRIWTVDHFLFADRFGGVAVIEFLGGEMVAYTGPDLCTAALTNSTYSYACSIWESSRSIGDYSGHDNSIVRFCRAADRLAEFREGSTAHAVHYTFETLREMYPPGLRWHTRWSIVFDTHNLRAYFKTQRKPEVRWVDLDAFDLRCGGPVMMLGINEVESGDVTGSFSEYDPERNREFREAYYDQWDLAYNPGETAQLLQYLESFPCTQARRAGGRRVVPIGQ
jgi:penicillin V acylase-like amidase (Ntn superfamily)